MLSMEAIKVRESNDLKQIEDFYFEVQRFYKTEYGKLEETRTQLYIKALNGSTEGQVNGWNVSYKPLESFRVDSQKLTDYFQNTLKVSENEMKNLIYSHFVSKPSLKLKTLKN